MKRFITPILLMLLFISTGCITTKAELKRQSQDNRRIGEAYMTKGNYAGALRYFLQAEQKFAEDHILQDDLGKVYIAKGKYDLAIIHFKKALMIEPDFAAGKNNLGSAYLLAEQWDNAIKVFKELNENLLYATPHYPMYNLGWAYYNKKDYETAIIYFNNSLKLQNGFILPLRGLGLSWYALGNHYKSIKYLEKATKNSPKFPQLYFDLGNAYSSANKFDKAVIAYRRVISMKPESEISELARHKIQKILN